MQKSMAAIVCDFSGSSASKQHLEELAKLLASLYELALMCYDDQHNSKQLSRLLQAMLRPGDHPS